MKTSDSFILFRLLFRDLHAVPYRRPILQRSARGLRLTARRMILLLLGVVAGFAAHTVQAGPRQSNPVVGPTGVIVQTQFGGQIFGFDIDQASNEGILCEAQTLDDGSVLAAIETFNQTTGAIIKIVRETQTQDDFAALGVVGNSVGLVEREHSAGGLKVLDIRHPGSVAPQSDHGRVDATCGHRSSCQPGQSQPGNRQCRSLCD